MTRYLLHVDDTIRITTEHCNCTDSERLTAGSLHGEEGQLVTGNEKLSLGIFDSIT